MTQPDIMGGSRSALKKHVSLSMLQQSGEIGRRHGPNKPVKRDYFYKLFLRAIQDLLIENFLKK